MWHHDSSEARQERLTGHRNEASSKATGPMPRHQ
jgi:hypothetical protein